VQQITALFTTLTGGGDALEESVVGLSSLVDTWLLLRELESNGERNRALYLLKSRGMAHSNQVREFLLTSHGIELVDVQIGPQGVLTGSARRLQEVRDQAAARARQEEIERRRRELERRRKAMEAEIERLHIELEAEEEELRRALAQDAGEEQESSGRRDLAWGRQNGASPAGTEEEEAS
jgi:circadian clock protein KaiC